MLAAGGLVVVAEAATPAGALDIVHQVRPDAALVDIGLPDGDGVALASYLAVLPWRPLVLRCGIFSFANRGRAFAVPSRSMRAGRLPSDVHDRQSSSPSNPPGSS
jgi:DNA-binding LytR/AlgR family response regulator